MSQLYFLGNSTHCQMFGCVIKTSSKTIVIDGGASGDGMQLSDLLNNIANSHVDAWFFTHPHHDHMGAFLEICKNSPEIEIDKILCDFPSLEMLEKHGMRTQREMDMWLEFDEIINLRFADSFVRVKKGDVYKYDDIKINVMRVFNPAITTNFVNNSSVVYRIDSPYKKVLILGDLGVDASDEVMQNCSAESLYADYTQLSHHGQGGASKEFYEYIKPQRCLWAAPEWLWNNDAGEGFDTGPWKTVITREWMSGLGVNEHIVEKDGTTIIDLSV